MSDVRVYLPATLATLARAYLEGRFEAGHAAHAVTPAVREWYVEGDLEELEYAALGDAAAASLRLLAAGPAAPGPVGTDGGTDGGRGIGADRYADRRVVVSADVEATAVVARADDHHRSAVRLGAEVAWSQVISVHVDDEGDAAARAAVAQAIASLAAAHAGDQDALFALDEAESHELLWYDVTEVVDLI